MSGAARGSYNERVRACFAHPAHAGDVPSMPGEAVTASATGAGGAQTVRLTAVTDGATLFALRYRVFGCPHLIAAAEAFCERFEGRRVETLAEFDVSELAAVLEVPVEKTGRMLLLEDAIRTLRAEFAKIRSIGIRD